MFNWKEFQCLCLKDELQEQYAQDRTDMTPLQEQHTQDRTNMTQISVN